jgi:predicted regulator of Ras-like GTPase activity (Roadblock/LC7/MglB family)
MDIFGRFSQRLILFALLAQVVPMVIFPEMLGLQLAKAALVYVLYELVYYAVVAYFFNRRASLLQLGQAAGLCLIFRLLMGSVFGVLIAAVYGMNISVSLSLGLSAYIPTILLHVAFAPFMLKPLIDRIIETRRPMRPQAVSRPVTAEPTTNSAEEHAWGGESAANKSHPASVSAVYDRSAGADMNESMTTNNTSDLSGFERAVRYVGEHGSVALVAVVDADGLLMARFVRGELDPEEWAPLSLVLMESNQRLLGRHELGTAEKLDFSLHQKRLIITRAGQYALMVIAERLSDEVVQIRIRQAVDLINKYVAERYAPDKEEQREHLYVSGTE